MRKILTGVLITCTYLIFADFSIPSVPKDGYVLDEVGVLDVSQKQALNTLIRTLEAETHHQIGVAIVQNLQGRPVEEFSLNLARTWGIGYEGVDNGLLILVALNERVVRIEVGRGLEGVMPDAVANRIIDDYMVPAFAGNAYFDGISAAIDVMRPALAGEIVQLPELPKNPFEIVFLLIIWLFWGSLFLGSVLFEPSKAWWPGIIVGVILGGIVLWLTIGTWIATGIGMVVSGVILGGMDWAFSTGKVRAARSRPNGGRWGGGGWGSGGGFGGGFGGSAGGGFGGGGFGGGGASGRW